VLVKWTSVIQKPTYKAASLCLVIAEYASSNLDV
jgi:hypothetical protein